MEDEHQEMEENSPKKEDESVPKPTKKDYKMRKLLKNSDSKRGIVYLSRIPTGMNVKLIRERFEVFGKTDRIFLQPDEKQPKGKKIRAFTEGWVEFKNKRMAKQVARTLNNQQVGGKKKQLWYWDLWNIKYLPKFKWGHLNERLAYEKAVHQQRLRVEIAKVKREANFYIQNIEMNEKRKRIESKKTENEEGECSSSLDREWSYRQTAPREDASERIKNENTSKKSLWSNKALLRTIFSGGVSHDADNDANDLL